MVTKLKTVEWKFREDKIAYDKYNRLPKINNPQVCFEVIKELMPEDLTVEFFGVLWLSSSNKAIGYEIIGRGTLNSSVVHPREVFRGAIVANAASIVLFHNHPSDSIEPLPEDVSITKKIAEAGKIVEIQVRDHLVIDSGKEKFISFVEKRLI